MNIWKCKDIKYGEEIKKFNRHASRRWDMYKYIMMDF